MGDASLGAAEISCAADNHHVVSAASEPVVVMVAASGGGEGEVHEAGSGDTDMVGDGSNSAEEGAAADNKGIRSEEGDRNYAGNRWPRQETLALLKIRSDMDATFRDSTLKGPLWEEVSRKMAELGYLRSSKKCKEKFENVYKYHKRTKEGRTGKSEGKTYRFFDQLEAFETHHSHQHHHHPQTLHKLHHPTSNKPAHQVVTTTASSSPWTTTTNSAPTISHIFAPSTTNPTIIPPLPLPTNPTNSLPFHTKSVVNHSLISDVPSNNSFPNYISTNLFSSSTSSTASDEEFQARHKRKRKWKDFFRKLTKEVLQKQEELQNKFLQAVEKTEHERMVREEAWRVQEMARINREHEILVQERSTAAAKDAAVIAFLQKVSGGGGVGQVVQNPNEVRVNIMTLPPPQPQPPPSPPPQQLVSATTKDNLEVAKLDIGRDNNAVLVSPSRWPKSEVQALIQLRTCLDLKYQDNGPKGPLWEEISAGMRRLGYNRSAKRCKEKWENINKYFKKVKDNKKKRPEDSKTCPYFHQLDALYREKSNRLENNPCNNIVENNDGVNAEKPVPSHMGIMEPPLMVQPERQWPAQQENQLDSVMEEIGRENIMVDPNEEEDDDDDDGDSTEDDEDPERGGYEIINNKQPSMDMVE